LAVLGSRAEGEARLDQGRQGQALRIEAVATVNGLLLETLSMSAIRGSVFAKTWQQD